MRKTLLQAGSIMSCLVLSFFFFKLHSTGNEVPFNVVQSAFVSFLFHLLYFLSSCLTTYFHLVSESFAADGSRGLTDESSDMCSKNCLFVFVQKADGTCNTNFKTTKTQEQVLQVFVEFIEGNTTILVSLNSSG